MSLTDSSCPLCHGVGWILSTNEEGAPQGQRCKCLEQKMIRQRIRFAEIPAAYREDTLANFDFKAYQTQSGQRTAIAAGKSIKKYICNFGDAYRMGLGLYLYSGAKGSGKTRMAASVANHLTGQGYTVKFAVGSKILDEIRKTYDKGSVQRESDLLEGLAGVDILFIDDFGAEQLTPWVEDRFYHIINERYINRKVTCYTSNDTVEDLQYGERIKSRVQGMTYQIPFPEESVRAALAAKRNQEFAFKNS